MAVAPFIINYSGCIFREYPGPWQVMLRQDSGQYACIAERPRRYNLARPRAVAPAPQLLPSLHVAQGGLLDVCSSCAGACHALGQGLPRSLRTNGAGARTGW